MSNEELAARIQAGEQELLPQLWAQVRRFVCKMAHRRYFATNGLGGVELDDLIQSGFLAVVQAVEYFKPDGEYKFLTYLDVCLKNAFASAGGYRANKRDPLLDCISLDTPLGNDSDSDTLLDLQEDPANQIEDAERRIWLEQLREKGLTIGFSTVYRQLDRLVEEGTVNKYTIDAVTGACYEYKGEHGADPAFVHGKCEKCGKVVHLERRSVEAAMHSLSGAKEDDGFELDPVRTLFYGIWRQD